MELKRNPDLWKEETADQHILHTHISPRFSALVVEGSEISIIDYAYQEAMKAREHNRPILKQIEEWRKEKLNHPEYQEIQRRKREMERESGIEEFYLKPTTELIKPVFKTSTKPKKENIIKNIFNDPNIKTAIDKYINNNSIFKGAIA